MRKSSHADTVQSAVAYGSLAIGALSVVAPKVFAKIYGVKGDGNLMTMIRMWGARNLVLGALQLTLESESDRRILVAATTGMGVVDLLAIACAGPDVPTSTKVAGVATAAAFAAGGGYMLAKD